MDTFQKIDTNTMKRTIQKTEEVTYDMDFLLSQKAQAEAGLKEINDLIAQATTLGLVSKVDVQPILK